MKDSTKSTISLIVSIITMIFSGFALLKSCEANKTAEDALHHSTTPFLQLKIRFVSAKKVGSLYTDYTFPEGEDRFKKDFLSLSGDYYLVIKNMNSDKAPVKESKVTIRMAGEQKGIEPVVQEVNWPQEIRPGDEKSIKIELSNWKRDFEGKGGKLCLIKIQYEFLTPHTQKDKYEQLEAISIQFR